MANGRLEHANILLGVTGSIAAYKACEVLRLLQREGASVRVVMTAAAQKFVTPLTFETLSGDEVITELFPSRRVVKTRHVAVADWAHCVLVCPATLNCIGKIAAGIADDFLTIAIAAARSPVVFAPAMDFQMARHPMYAENCERLQARGYRFVSFEEGELASGATGAGRLARLERIVDGVRLALSDTSRLPGIRVLVTAGPTREPIDPVRFLSNRSSGKMGLAIAEEAVLRGAEVTLVTGAVPPHAMDGIRVVPVATAADMASAVEREWKRHDALFMAAAVADFRPKTVAVEKIKKSTGRLLLEMETTDDILSRAAAVKGNRTVVGFALETGDGPARARQKLIDKKLDLICLNNPLEPGSGFETDTNRITIIAANADPVELPLMPKWEAARRILDTVEGRMKTEAAHGVGA